MLNVPSCQCLVALTSTLHLLVRTCSIILIFAQQANRILDNIGSVFRVFVPMCLYFIIMWAGTFFLVYYLTSRKEGSKKYGYKMAVVQSFTAGSNK